mmetsp:Transcript_173412/g.556242  ORF Transcript_173412/g.556242 Transcript_173412/m.556242 type:complete len:212 (+) Transcript_173412:378-1013(+)
MLNVNRRQGAVEAKQAQVCNITADDDADGAPDVAEARPHRRTSAAVDLALDARLALQPALGRAAGVDVVKAVANVEVKHSAVEGREHATVAQARVGLLSTRPRTPPPGRPLGQRIEPRQLPGRRQDGLEQHERIKRAGPSELRVHQPCAAHGVADADAPPAARRGCGENLSNVVGAELVPLQWPWQALYPMPRVSMSCVVKQDAIVRAICW